MAKKTIITADSTCDLSHDLVQAYDIRIIPLVINMNGKTYHDGVDLQPDDIYANYDLNHNLPTTAAPSPADYEAVFRPIVEAGNAVVHITISGKMSSSIDNAMSAAQGMADVHIVDSRNLSTGSGHLVLLGAEHAKAGRDPAWIAGELARVAQRVDASFLVDTLEYLHKGGRCSAIAMLGANMLRLKPCIEVKDGAMGVGKKYRGSLDKCLVNYVEERLRGHEDDIDPKRIFITHSGCTPQTIEAVRAKINDIMTFEEVLITRAGCTISSHCGPNTLGILYIHI